MFGGISDVLGRFLTFHGSFMEVLDVWGGFREVVDISC